MIEIAAILIIIVLGFIIIRFVFGGIAELVISVKNIFKSSESKQTHSANNYKMTAGYTVANAELSEHSVTFKFFMWLFAGLVIAVVCFSYFG